MKMYYSKHCHNFGDDLSPIVLKYMMGEEVPFTSYLTKGKILCIGSILKALRENDIVWGSGSMYDQPIIPPPNVTFLAVRGPLTMELIQGDCPDVYGDPALLMPKIYNPPINRKTPRYKIGVLPHKVDHHSFSNLVNTSINLIDITSNVYSIIDQIRLCDVLISSSLHGIIVAEAYGIPAVWIRVSDNILGGNFKFHDYLAATERDLVDPVTITGKISMLDIVRASKHVLPKPIIDTEPLEEAFRNYFKL